MEPQLFQIGHIPAALWGPESDRVIIAVHGAQSHKADDPIRVLAEIGCTVLSFDLPEHGDRRGSPMLCGPRVCSCELSVVLDYAQSRWRSIGLFAVSLGAYFSLLACQDRPITHAWFLSPVVDLTRLTENMMTWFSISPEQLERDGTVDTPMGQSIRWEDLLYLRANPVRRWPVPTDILRGGGDTLCEEETIQTFAKRFSCRVRTEPAAEHWFHTPQDLAALASWLRETM